MLFLHDFPYHPVHLVFVAFSGVDDRIRQLFAVGKDKKIILQIQYMQFNSL